MKTPPALLLICFLISGCATTQHVQTQEPQKFFVHGLEYDFTKITDLEAGHLLYRVKLHGVLENRSPYKIYSLSMNLVFHDQADRPIAAETLTFWLLGPREMKEFNLDKEIKTLNNCCSRVSAQFTYDRAEVP